MSIADRNRIAACETATQEIRALVGTLASTLADHDKIMKRNEKKKRSEAKRLEECMALLEQIQLDVDKLRLEFDVGTDEY